jgi:hypothetical protein
MARQARFGRVGQWIVEALGGSLLGSTASSSSDNDAGWRPITARAREGMTRDLDPLSQDRMLKVALYLYGSNPLAKFLINKPVGLCVGRSLGYSVTIDAEGANLTPEAAKAKAAAIRAVLDPFWNHPAMAIGAKPQRHAKTYLVTGHLVYPAIAVNSVSGAPQFDFVDAGQISGVDPAPNSSIVPATVRYRPQGSDSQERSLSIVQADAEGFMLPEPPENDRPKSCLYFAHGDLLNSLRGQSVLMAVADWLDGLDQFTWTALDRAKIRNSLVYHLTVKGAQEAKLKDEVAKLAGALVNPGGIYASNEDITLEPKSSNIEEGDLTGIGRFILVHILGSQGIPESWYGSGGETNRATASDQTDVTFKTLLELQDELRDIYRTLLWCAYDSIQAKQPGRYPPRPASPWLSIEPTLPQVQERDVTRLATSLGQLVSALGDAVESRIVSRKTTRGAVLGLVSKLTGQPVEFDEEVRQIETETAEDEKSAAARANELVRRGLERIPDDDDEPDDEKPEAAGGAAA